MFNFLVNLASYLFLLCAIAGMLIFLVGIGIGVYEFIQDWIARRY